MPEPTLRATASSLDGLRFTFQCPIEGLELRPGGYVSVGGRLGQVHGLEPANVADGSRRFALVEGDGALLEDTARPFHQVAIEPAGGVEVAAWLERTRPRRASLDGRRFTFQASLHGLALRLGGYVVVEHDGGQRLGQVLELEPA